MLRKDKVTHWHNTVLCMITKSVILTPFNVEKYFKNCVNIGTAWDNVHLTGKITFFVRLWPIYDVIRRVPTARVISRICGCVCTVYVCMSTLAVQILL